MIIRKITVNAGHCPGQDSGAVGPTGLQEATVAKEISEQVCVFLQDVGYEVQFVQENELEDICRLTDEFESDLCVSIHCNSAGDPAAHGMEIFTTKGETDADLLATCVMDELILSKPTSGLTVRGDYDDGDVDKEENFYVLRHTACPATLVEVAFISNPDEEQMLSEAASIYAIAGSIARGITNYHAKVA